MKRGALGFRFGEFATSVAFGPFAGAKSSGSVLYVCDARTRGFVPTASPVILPRGEEAKNWSSVEAVVTRALAEGLSRDSVIVGVGGGALTDVAAFAASVYLRGCVLELAPTTLLAMVDAALGGKTAINFGGYKNMIGTFYPASVIHVDGRALAGLDDRQYRSGLAEVIKTAMLGDAELFEILRRRRSDILGRDPSLLEDIVYRCLAVKGRIVEADLREAGLRACLNFGHTFGHGLEAAAGVGNLTHGEAVAWGMLRALDAGVRVGVTAPGYAGIARDLIAGYGYTEVVSGVSPSAVLAAMRRDKKRREGGLKFVLQKELGDTVLVELPAEVVAAVLAGGLADSAG